MVCMCVWGGFHCGLHSYIMSETALTFQSVSSRGVAIHCISNILINVICFEVNFTQKGSLLCFLYGKKEEIPLTNTRGSDIANMQGDFH